MQVSEFHNSANRTSREYTHSTNIPYSSVGLSVERSAYGNRICFYRYKEHFLGALPFKNLPVCVRIPSETALLSDSVWRGRRYLNMSPKDLEYVALDLNELSAGVLDPYRGFSGKKLNQRKWVCVETAELSKQLRCSLNEIATLCKPLLSNNCYVASSIAYCSLQELDRLLFNKSRVTLKQALKQLKEDYPGHYNEVMSTLAYKRDTLTLEKMSCISIFHQIDTIQTQLVWLVSIELKDCLICVVPESIGMLTQLERLDLSNNLITHLPDTVGSLQQLRELILTNNSFYRFTDRAFLRLSSLKTIDLRGNPLEAVATQLLDLENFLYDPLLNSDESLPSSPIAQCMAQFSLAQSGFDQAGLDQSNAK